LVEFGDPPRDRKQVAVDLDEPGRLDLPSLLEPG